MNHHAGHRADTRRRVPGPRILSLLLLLPLLALLGPANPTTPTQANWREDEWVASQVGTLDCTAGDVYLTRGAGRLLSGGLLPLDLDTIATVGGMTVTHDTVQATPDPSTATALGSNAWINSLDVSALGLINLPLTGTALGNFLTIPLNNNVGVVNQYGRANGDGTSTGAAGVVNNSGAVATANDPGTGEPPELGTLKLSALVSALTGEAVSDVVADLADLSLEIGAVAGRAHLDACAADWTNDLDAHLEREYAIAGLDAVITSPTISGVVTATNGAVADIETLLNGLASDSTVIQGITGALIDLIAPLLTPLEVLGLVSVTASVTSLSVTADFTAVDNLLTQDISDTNNVVLIDLDGGTMRVNLAALLGQAYGGVGFNGTQTLGLNGLPPNTELVLKSAVVNALTAAVASALDDWTTDVVDAVEAALYAAEVDLVLDASVILASAEVIDVDVTLTDVELGSLTGQPGAPAPVIGVQVNSLAGTCNPLFPLSLACVVDGLLGPILNAVSTGIGPAVGGVLEAAIFANGATLTTLGNTVSAATAPVVTLLGNVLNAYLGVDGVVSLRANIQNDAWAGNDPDPATAPYADWEAGALVVPDGRYDVAALGVGVLNVGGPGVNVNLELGRGSVGINCPAGSPTPCAGY